jgi:hypothetical protein
MIELLPKLAQGIFGLRKHLQQADVAKRGRNLHCPGVSSNAHARIRTTGNSRITAVTKTFVIHAGASKVEREWKPLGSAAT